MHTRLHTSNTVLSTHLGPGNHMFSYNLLVPIHKQAPSIYYNPPIWINIFFLYHHSIKRCPPCVICAAKSKLSVTSIKNLPQPLPLFSISYLVHFSLKFPMQFLFQQVLILCHPYFLIYFLLVFYKSRFLVTTFNIRSSLSFTYVSTSFLIGFT